MWLFAVITLGLPAILMLFKKTRCNTSLWGQLAVACFPFALLFASALTSGLGPATVEPQRIAFLALCAVLCLAFCTIRHLMLTRNNNVVPKSIHPLFFFICALYIALCLIDINTSPIWDAGLYYSSVLKTVTRFDFTFLSFMSTFSAQSHITQMLLLLYAPGQYLFYGNVAVLNATTMLIGLCVLFCFYRAMQHLFAHSSRKPLVATALLAFMPQIFAFATGINPDFGVFAGLVFSMYCYITKKPVAAVSAALLLVFSKETGILVYGGFGLGIILFDVLPTALKKRSFMAFIRRALEVWYYLVPLVLFGLSFLVGGAGALGNPARVESLVSGKEVGSFGFNFLRMVTVINQVFLMNFNWVVTLAVCVGLVCWIVHVVRKKENPVHLLLSTAAQTPLWGALFCAVFIYLLFTLFYIDFPLMRYNLPTLVLLPPFFAAALSHLPRKNITRNVLPVAVLVLYIAGCYTTVDPVSRFAFPYSLSVGKTQLLDATNHTGFKYVCERHIYNREYLRYSRLLDDVVADNGVGTPYICYDVPEFAMQFFGNLKRDYRLGYSKSKSRRVFYTPDAQPIPGSELYGKTMPKPNDLPPKMLWIVLPSQQQDTLDELRKYYKINGEKVYARSGFSITVYDCARIS